MARANRTGVPGLVLLEAGPRAGRYMLGFRYQCPLTGKSARLSKLYPISMPPKAVIADAAQLVEEAVAGVPRSDTDAARAQAKAVLRAAANQLGSSDRLLALFFEEFKEELET